MICAKLWVRLRICKGGVEIVTPGGYADGSCRVSPKCCWLNIVSEFLYLRRRIPYTLESHICDHSRDRVVAIRDTQTADRIRRCNGWYQTGSGAESSLQESCEIGLTNRKDPVMFSEALVKLEG